MSEKTTDFDMIIVGAGFAGLYMLHKMRGLGYKAHVVEKGTDVGGTWYWNRYPGARCDIESLDYSYQFDEDLQQEWEWSERYATQPEILKYLRHVADRFDLRKDIDFETTVKAAHFDEGSGKWNIKTDKGDFTARYCVMATGCLSSPNIPDFKGQDSFKGDVYHTGYWPHEGVDFTGKRVGIIGTGSSAIQSIPLIAEQAAHLYVFQRTPNFSVPAHNGQIDAARIANVKSHYKEYRAQNKTRLAGFGEDGKYQEMSIFDVPAEEVQAELDRRWAVGGLQFGGGFADTLFDKKANDIAAEYVRGKIRETVKDPKTAELLCPDSVLGCKRMCVDTNYYDTYNRDNVTLVDVSGSGVQELTEKGLIAAGDEYELDAVVFATGFDAMTGSLNRIDIQGIGGAKLKDKWSEGPKAYLGLMIAGFPNLFTVTGPGSPSVLTNMVPTIEQHVEFIADAIEHLKKAQKTTIDADPEAQDAWVAQVRGIADMTLLPTCNSWYQGANIPGKPRVFMPYLGFPSYIEKCEEVVAKDYEGFKVG
ncbi:MAG: NAD(P)/FAD-dependent oxidoreductase [Alphaproteobacteria bacterium]|nr:MAG: NAD(P)/FAD-dependent oxidoreductase [Alphaproteobacteria bacterium]